MEKKEKKEKDGEGNLLDTMSDLSNVVGFLGRGVGGFVKILAKIPGLGKLGGLLASGGGMLLSGAASAVSAVSASVAAAGGIGAAAAGIGRHSISRSRRSGRSHRFYSSFSCSYCWSHYRWYRIRRI